MSPQQPRILTADQGLLTALGLAQLDGLGPRLVPDARELSLAVLSPSFAAELAIYTANAVSLFKAGFDFGVVPRPISLRDFPRYVLGAGPAVYVRHGRLRVGPHASALAHADGRIASLELIERRAGVGELRRALKSDSTAALAGRGGATAASFFARYPLTAREARAMVNVMKSLDATQVRFCWVNAACAMAVAELIGDERMGATRLPLAGAAVGGAERIVFDLAGNGFLYPEQAARHMQPGCYDLERVLRSAKTLLELP